VERTVRVQRDAVLIQRQLLQMRQIRERVHFDRLDLVPAMKKGCLSQTIVLEVTYKKSLAVILHSNFSVFRFS